MAFSPSVPFNVGMVLLIPSWADSYGVGTKTYPAVKDGVSFFGSFRSFSGNERVINGITVQDSSGVIDTWYNPQIKADCRVVILQTGDVYEIEGEPENISMRNQFTRFRVRLYKGGA